VLSEDFCARKFVIKIHAYLIYTDYQITFWIGFAFYFISCYNSGMYYRNLERLNETV